MHKHNLQLIELRQGSFLNIKIAPRGFSTSVFIDEQALLKICDAQKSMPPAAILLITRAYQPESLLRRKLRQLGSRLFALIYPRRAHEAGEIFFHNGHASNGMHIDIAVEHHKRRIQLLPFGVFTPKRTIVKRRLMHSGILQQTEDALTAAGFTLHPNQTEASQIHIDFKP